MIFHPCHLRGRDRFATNQFSGFDLGEQLVLNFTPRWVVAVRRKCNMLKNNRLLDFIHGIERPEVGKSIDEKSEKKREPS